MQQAHANDERMHSPVNRMTTRPRPAAATKARLRFLKTHAAHLAQQPRPGAESEFLLSCDMAGPLPRGRTALPVQPAAAGHVQHPSFDWAARGLGDPPRTAGPGHCPAPQPKWSPSGSRAGERFPGQKPQRHHPPRPVWRCVG